jgi:hypothetical protein
MRQAALPTLMVLVSACVGNESPASRNGPITDASADVATAVEGGTGPIAAASSDVGVDSQARRAPWTSTARTAPSWPSNSTVQEGELRRSITGATSCCIRRSGVYATAPLGARTGIARPIASLRLADARGAPGR